MRRHHVALIAEEFGVSAAYSDARVLKNTIVNLAKADPDRSRVQRQQHLRGRRSKELDDVVAALRGTMRETMTEGPA